LHEVEAEHTFILPMPDCTHSHAMVFPLLIGGAVKK